MSKRQKGKEGVRFMLKGKGQMVRRWEYGGLKGTGD